MHGWFVEHVQDGEDDCGEYSVSIEQLYDLRNKVEGDLNDGDNMNMRNTITNLNSAIDMHYRQHDNLSIMYHSSW